MVLGVTGDGESALLSERRFCAARLAPFSHPVPRLNARRTPASLVSPTMHQRENVQIKTPSSLNHSPMAHRSLTVSSRQTVLCRLGLARNIAVLSEPALVLFHITESLNSRDSPHHQH